MRDISGQLQLLFTVSDTNPLNTNEYSSYRFFWVTGSGNLVIKVYSGDSSSTTGDIGLLEFYEISANSGTMENAESTDLTVATSGGRAADPTVTQYVGGELVTNGTFDGTDGQTVSGWVANAVTSPVTTATYDSDRLKVQHGAVTESIVTETGKMYQLKVDFIQSGSFPGGIYVGTTSGGSSSYNLHLSGSLTSSQAGYTVVFKATSSETFINLWAWNGSNTIGYYDNLSVREVNYANTDLVMYNRLGDGGVAKALGFDGGDDAIDLGSLGTTGAAFTYSAWFKTTNATAYQTLINVDGNTTGNPQLRVHSGKVQMRGYGSTNTLAT